MMETNNKMKTIENVSNEKVPPQDGGRWDYLKNAMWFTNSDEEKNPFYTLKEEVDNQKRVNEIQTRRLEEQQRWISLITYQLNKRITSELPETAALATNWAINYGPDKIGKHVFWKESSENNIEAIA